MWNRREKGASVSITNLWLSLGNLLNASEQRVSAPAKHNQHHPFVQHAINVNKDRLHSHAHTRHVSAFFAQKRALDETDSCIKAINSKKNTAVNLLGASILLLLHPILFCCIGAVWLAITWRICQLFLLQSIRLPYKTVYLQGRHGELDAIKFSHWYFSLASTLLYNGACFLSLSSTSLLDE